MLLGKWSSILLENLLTDKWVKAKIHGTGEETIGADQDF